jgi:hypothetical protein
MAITLSLPGYAKLRVGSTRGLVIETCLNPVEEILATATLYDYARSQPGARSFQGRAPAYALSIDGCGDVVVRHAMRGGALGRTGTDLFMPPTRGLRELVNSLRLRLAGVPTPEVVAIVSYRAGPILRRSDVATREIPESHDLAIVLREITNPGERASCLEAAGSLLGAMSRAGAHHPDLNARNVLITWDAPDGAKAHILDVDRIRFHVPSDPMVAKANMERLQRSLIKLRSLDALAVSDAEIAVIESASRPKAQ